MTPAWNDGSGPAPFVQCLRGTVNRGLFFRSPTRLVHSSKPRRPVRWGEPEPGPTRKTMNNELHHLIYKSSASDSVTPDVLHSILGSARARNGQLDITGLLLFSEGTFFQVLEGGRTQVESLFSDICTDARHFDVTRIISEEIASRSFGEWKMGFARPDEHGTEEGHSDFFEAGNSLELIKEGRARKILAAFGQGRWRASIAT